MGHFKLSVAVSMIALLPCSVFAQNASDYPSRTVRVVVASSPGGGSDFQARLFAQKLSESMKQQFVVDDRPGAGDTIGTNLVVKAAPDGYTLLVATASLTMAPAVYPQFPVDPTKDLAPISLVDAAPLLLLVHPSVPAKSARELIALAKAKPGQLMIAVGPGGTFTHLTGVLFGASASIDLAVIPYANVGQRYSDTIAGQTHIVFMAGPVALPYMQAGRLRALGLSSAKRASAFPDLPTLAEAGATGYDITNWYGWLAPGGTPAAIVAKLNAELVKAVRTPDVLSKLAADGVEPVGGTPAQFTQLINAEIPRWKKAVAVGNVHVE